MAATDRCQLPELRLRCISQVALHLATKPGDLAATFADVALVVERCDDRLLTQLLGLVLAASDERIGNSLAAPSAALKALEQAANPGSFDWALESFSRQPSAVGESIESPWFNVAGKQWRFVVYPGGDKEQAAGDLSGKLSLARTSF